MVSYILNYVRYISDISHRIYNLIQDKRYLYSNSDMLYIRYLISYISNIVDTKYLFCIIRCKVASSELFYYSLYKTSYIRYKISFTVYKLCNLFYTILYVI